MGDLFNRDFAINLGGTRIASDTVDGEANNMLRVVFNVVRTRTRSANTASVEIWNLSEVSRGKVSQKDLETTIEAGYAGRASVIFSGNLDAGKNKRNGVDWVTSFESTDGGKKIRESRVNISFGGGISIEQAINKAVDAIGVGLGNARKKIAEGNVRGALTAFGNGLVLSGSATDEFDKLVKSVGYDWSIQDGQLELTGPGDAIDENIATVLSKDTGLVGSPQQGENGIIEARSLLIPRLLPNRVVNLQSLEATGFYRIDRVEFRGDTYGQDWYADLELSPR